MDNLILRFAHVVERIFVQLDDKSLAKCREVEKSWKKFIDERNYPWIRIVEIPKVYLKYGFTYLHLAAQTGQTEMFQLLIDKEDDEKNPQNENGQTPFHLCCSYGHSRIVDIILKNSIKSNICNLSAKDHECGWTAFHFACNHGQTHIGNSKI